MAYILIAGVDPWTAIFADRTEAGPLSAEDLAHQPKVHTGNVRIKEMTRAQRFSDDKGRGRVKAGRRFTLLRPDCVALLG